jgi:hypothetical protein
MIIHSQYKNKIKKKVINNLFEQNKNINELYVKVLFIDKFGYEQRIIDYIIIGDSYKMYTNNSINFVNNKMYNPIFFFDIKELTIIY